METNTPRDIGAQPSGVDAAPDATKEKAKERKIFIIYRDNDLFSAHMPQVTSTLEGMGNQIESHSFPAGTPEKEMSSWAEEHTADLADKVLVTDDTLKVILDKIMHFTYNDPRLAGNLDEILGFAMDGAILERANPYLIKEEHEDIEATKEMFINVAKEIINSQGKPPAIAILLEKINDHGPFTRFAGKAMKARGVTDVMTERFKKNIEDELPTGEIIKQWLIEAGIEEGSIHLFKGHNPDIDMQKMGILVQPSCWVIIDRHNFSVVRNAEAKVLPLPINSLVNEVIKKGWIQGRDPERVRKSLDVILREEFSPPSDNKS